MYSEKYYLISDYQSMELLGVNGLFTNFRVDRQSLPEGFYKYSLREGVDDSFSSVKDDVSVNHMGDFICKQELDLNGQDECDLFGDYDFTNKEVDLDEFFGDDIKYKIAQELDAFCYDFDPYEYRDNMPSGSTREDAIESIKIGLSDKEYVSEMLRYFENILSDNESENHFEYFHVVAELTERSSSCATTKTGTDNDNVEFAFVSGANDFDVTFMFRPLAFDRACGNFGIKFNHIA